MQPYDVCVRRRADLGVRPANKGVSSNPFTGQLYGSVGGLSVAHLRGAVGEPGGCEHGLLAVEGALHEVHDAVLIDAQTRHHPERGWRYAGCAPLRALAALVLQHAAMDAQTS